MYMYVFSFLLASMNQFFGASEVINQDRVLVINMADEEKIPRNFRHLEDATQWEGKPSLNTQGLKDLHVSGSGQFSEKSLAELIKRFKTGGKIHVVDLREESHGFLNGSAVSWYSVRNRINLGKSAVQIMREEEEWLREALKKKEIVLSRVCQKDSEGLELPRVEPFDFTVMQYETEEKLADKMGLEYQRFLVTDAMRPRDEVVDAFLAWYKTLSDEDHVHFHCAAGSGRTTTFMAMFDILKNCKKVSFEEIIYRQHLLGGKNLADQGAPNSWKHECFVDRYTFIRGFYDYVRSHADGLTLSWTDHQKRMKGKG